MARLASGEPVSLDDLDGSQVHPGYGAPLEGLEVPLGEEGTLAAEPFPHPLGGGSYELSDGSHVKGKARALAAQADLDVAGEAA